MGAIIKVKIIITFMIAIIIMLTISPWINLNSSINSIYQSIVKQLAIGIVLFLIISGCFLVLYKFKIGYFEKCIYAILIFCAVSNIKYCREIYGDSFLGFNIDNLNFYSSYSKTSYYELDLSYKANVNKCILYTPTSLDVGNCIIYIMDKEKDEKLESILFYRDIVINEGNSFMILGLDTHNIDKAKKDIEYDIEQFKKDDIMNEAILMVEEDSKEYSLVTEISKSTSINGVIELNTSGDLQIQKDKNDKYKNVHMLTLQGNDTFIRTSIIGDIFEKEFIHWMRTDI